MNRAGPMSRTGGRMRAARLLAVGAGLLPGRGACRFGAPQKRRRGASLRRGGSFGYRRRPSFSIRAL